MRVPALACGLILVLQANLGFEVVPEQTGYVTGAPMLDWLGLATLGGRDAVQLGDGCVGVRPGVNVVVADSGDLHVMDPVIGLQADECVISRRMHMSDVPCATDPAGACDVAFN